ncbi:hypothetical protein QEH59_10470 [Coraliomargarita sp. SDUM461004]|uniref:Uncharacterized protein n=1 Tax=Thalassobacterium sedimentorum TaxID=3041258 RepID=A0ABU1AJ92_9BACT|nr:hypothetical protein [Coraliomargarita sp. SDUM461004]MDQ8194851.1 hypothetical protein [Coraliomargarita sp. SDUM461004]
MAELTNLTDRLAHLRDRKSSSPAIKEDKQRPEPVRQPKKSSRPERRFANDYFMFFAYALLTVALLTQFALIACLDIL